MSAFSITSLPFIVITRAPRSTAFALRHVALAPAIVTRSRAACTVGALRRPRHRCRAASPAARCRPRPRAAIRLRVHESSNCRARVEVVDDVRVADRPVHLAPSALHARELRRRCRSSLPRREVRRLSPTVTVGVVAADHRDRDDTDMSLPTARAPDRRRAPCCHQARAAAAAATTAAARTAATTRTMLAHVGAVPAHRDEPRPPPYAKMRSAFLTKCGVLPTRPPAR